MRRKTTRAELYTNGESEITITPLSVEPYLLYIDDVTNEGDGATG